MKKLFYTCALLLSGFGGFAQNCLWHENFEAIDSVINDPGLANPTWTQTNQVFLSGSGSFFSPVTVTPNAAQTITFNTVGQTFVTLSFWHICRVDFLDAGTLEWSVNGVDWFPIDASSMDPTSCSFGTFLGQGSVFTSASNLNWDPANPGTPANNTMWCKESFDISFLGGVSTAQVRWLLTDLDANGANGYPGWYLEDVCINYAPCELIPPVHVNNLLSGTVYSLGPYTLTDSIFDLSGIATANLVYTVNGGTPVVVPMNPVSNGVYQGVIPAVNDGDTLCYYFEATDASPCANYSRSPDPTCQQFFATTGIGFPFCDNFDSQNLWINNTVAGSGWDLGTPTSNPNAPHSAPNSWDVALNARYLANSESYLTLTQPIDFTQALNASIEFWFYCNAENSWDGARLEWKSTQTPAWTILGSCNDVPPLATNWYNDCALNSSLVDAWTGTAGVWTKAKHNLAVLGGQSAVEFRFVFTSDASVDGEGFAVDDLCITVPSPNDAGVEAILTPSGQPAAGTCEPVTVTITNFGNQPLVSTPVTYINSVTGHTETQTWTGNLPPNGFTQFTFTVCDTVPAGSYCILSYTSLSGDGNLFNDSITNCMVGIPTLNVPLCDDFESGNAGWVATGQWQQGTPAFGATTGAHSPVTAWDINLAGPYATGSSDTLYTPFYNLTGAVNPYMSFWHNHNTSTQDAGFWIEYTNNGSTWQTLGTFGTQPDALNWYNQVNLDFLNQAAWDGNSNGWTKSTYFLTNILGGSTSLRFRFVFHSGFNAPLDGVSIDDFCVTIPPPIDAGVISTQSAGGSALPQGNNEQVIIDVRNFGTTNLTSIGLTYEVSPIGGAPIFTSSTTTWTGTLLPNNTFGNTGGAITHPDSYVVPVGDFEICAWTTVTGDADASNDTTCTFAVGVPVLVIDSLTPYCDDFESGNVGWQTTVDPAGNPGTIWELGAPAFGLTTGAHSGSNAWDINLNTGYTGNGNCILTSPIFDFSNAVSARLGFWRNNDTEDTWDGTRMEFRVGAGAWTILGTCTSTQPDAENWYEQCLINSSNQDAWAGTTNGWVNSIWYKLDNYGGFTFDNAPVVQFRYIFTTDASVQQDGFSIDDFCIEVPPPVDAGVVIAESGGGGAVPQGLNDQVRIDVRNFGTLALGTTPTIGLTYHIKSPIGGPVVFTSTTVPWTGTNLPPNQTFATNGGLVLHPDPYIVPTGPFEICAWTTVIGDPNSYNDTSCATATGVPIIAIDYNNSYCDDFEGTNAGWTTSIISGGNPLSVWEYGTPANGATTGAYSGVNAWDVNLNIPYTINANCVLTSPVFDFTNAVGTKLNFWRNHNTDLFGDGTRLEFRVGTGAWTLLGACTTTPPTSLNWLNQCNIGSSGQDAWAGNSGGWVNSIWYNLNNYAGNQFDNAPQVQFRFIFTSDAFGPLDGFSLDNFCLEVPVPLTTTPTSIGSNNIPSQLIFPGQCINFRGNIKNDGTTAINSTVATLMIDGFPWQVDTVVYGTPLPSGIQQLHTFSNCWGASPGPHDICIITSLPNNGPDLRPVNDTICYSILVLDSVDVSQVNYCNDFEGALPPWLTLNSLNYGPNTSWELGTPNKNTIIGTHSGANCWITDLVNDYPIRDTSSLFTPVFKVTPGLPYKMQFWTNFDTERNEDGGTVEYSTDYAATWTTLGNERDPNWMNTYNITALGSVPPVRPGWSSSSNNAWFDVSHGICFSDSRVNNVIFRFRFASDFSINYDGWAIDDFCYQLDLSSPLCSVVVGVNEVMYEDMGFYLQQNIPNPFNNQSVIKFGLTKPGLARLTVTNVVGQVVMQPLNEKLMPGTHEVIIDGNKLAPGIYYYTLTFNNKQLTKKMVITE